MLAKARQAACAVVLLSFWCSQTVCAATRTWDGNGGDAKWSTPANWDGDATAPSSGDDLVFAGSSSVSSNDLASFTVNALTASGLTAPLVIDGTTFSLTAGLSQLTPSHSLTLATGLTLTGAQIWQAGNATLITGDLAGSANLEVRSTDPGTTIDNNLAAIPGLRLSGSNGGYTGTITFKRLLDGSTQRSSLMLMAPSAMTGGNVDMSTNQRQALVLNGDDVASAYTFTIGTGAGQVQMSNTESGVSPANGDVVWDPGNGGGYTWPNVAGNRFGVWSPRSGDYSMLTIGTAGQTFVLGGAAKTLAIGGQSIVRMAATLADDGSARNLTKSNNGLLVLAGGSFGGVASGTTTVSGGALALSDMARIADGNLNLSGGVLIMDGLNWSQFLSDRGGGYGTGANQWQLSGTGTPGFAARGGAVTIDNTGTTETTFARNFALGSHLRGTNGLLYADQPVILNRGAGVNTIVLSTTANQTIRTAGYCNEGRLTAGSTWRVSGPVNEIAGKLTGGDTSRALIIYGTGNNAGQGGILRLSNAANDFTVSTSTTVNSMGLRLHGSGASVIIGTDDAVFGNAANSIQVGEGANGEGTLLLFEDQVAGAKTFSRPFFVPSSNGSGGDSGFGSYGGDVIYTGTATISGSCTEVPVYAHTNSTLTLGVAGGTAATFVNNRSSSTQFLKQGMGEVNPANVSYGGTQTSWRWRLTEGILRTDSVVPLKSTDLAIGELFNSGVTTSSPRTWRVRTANQTYNNVQTGDFSHNVALDVGAGLTLTLNMGEGQYLRSTELFGIAAGFTFGMRKVGEGRWTYYNASTAPSAGGRLNGYVKVEEGVFDVTGDMGRVGLWISGGELYSGSYSPLVGTTQNNRLRVDSDGGKIGISTTAAANVSRGIAFDGTDNVWDLGGSGTVTLASRGNLNLVFSASTFPDINAGETVRIERDGTGTGVVQLNDTAWTIAGRIGGAGGLKLGTAGTGTLTVSGGLAPLLASDTQGPLGVDGSVVLDSADIDASLAVGYAPGVSQWVILEADDVSGTLGTVTTGYVAQVTATQVILMKSGGTLVLVR